MRHPERFERGAVRMYATFDLGLIALLEAADRAALVRRPARTCMEEGKTPELRRMMVEYGEEFWKSGWAPLYDFLAGNPLAAMPSLHFATSVMAARLLGETGPVAGALGWAYAATLGVALVYLGEHYVVDLAAGYALTEAVRRAAPRLDGPRRRALARGAGAGGAGRMSTEADASARDATRASHVDLTPRKLIAFGALRRADGRRAVLPAAAARRPRRHLAPHPGRRPGLADRSPAS